MATPRGALLQPASGANASCPKAGNTSTCDDGLSAFLGLRPRLFGIAYRMLGSAAEAEDVVQEAWVRWQTADRGLVRDAAAFLATTTRRLAINVMQSARSQRETHVGPWLPEPVDTSADPVSGAERGEALELGIWLLLERLSPTERAAYILREAFDYAYREIANVLRLEEANARQVVTRARQHVSDGRRAHTTASGQRRVLTAFTDAARNGDVARFERLLASDAGASQRISLSGPWFGEHWRNGDEEDRDVGTRALACERRNRRSGRRRPATPVEGPRRGAGPRTVDDLRRLPARNASSTARARFLVVLVKDKGAPILMPVK